MKPIVPILLLLCAAAQSRAAELPSGWPEGWRAAYERFEKFLESRSRIWPASGLEISADGKVQVVLDIEETRESRLSLKIFQDGVGNIAAALKDGEGTAPLQVFSALLPDRLNAAVAQISGVPGYQQIPPIVWFEVQPEPGSERTLFGGRNRKLRVLPAPEPAEDFLPNERLLAWRDFQVLPNGFPQDIREANSKANPAVFLQVDQDGTIHRGLLPDADAEAALEWRVYLNGRLVDRSAATGKTRLPLARLGVGNFTVLAGITGPAGFLPVSNLLEFTLAPDSGEKPRLLFSQFDYGRPEDYPPWYAAILPPPVGSGPAVFDSAEDLEAARTLGSAWRGCADLYNASDAVWVRPDDETP